MFFLPLYILSLAVSAGIIGLFARRLLHMAGAVPDFNTGLILAGGVALAYMCLQLLYMGFVKFITATRGAGPLFAETLSHAAALVLVPFFLGMGIPLPDTGSENLEKILDKGEPLIFMGAFVALHFGLKLLALFGATVSREGNRLWAAGWIAAAAACGYGALQALNLWQASIVEARAHTLAEQEPFKVGNFSARGQRLREGLVYSLNLPRHNGHPFSLRVASPPPAPEQPQEVTLTVRANAADPNPWMQTLTLDPSAWTELHIGPLPLDQESLQVVWVADAGLPLLAKAGLQPLNTTDREIVVSGPFVHETRAASEDPNMVVIMLDGLGAEHFASMDYDRNPAPLLDALAAENLSYRYAYTPCPESKAGCMTVLTGLVPLAHGYFETYDGPLPEQIKTLPEILRERGYVTAAFTEGSEGGALSFDSEFSRGFELFDDEYAYATSRRGADDALPGGSSAQASSLTLEKAAEWMEKRKDQKFFVFIRLRELESPQDLDRYVKVFTRRDGLRMRDVYDNAIYNVDLQIGKFMQRLTDSNLTSNTAFVFSSSYGLTLDENTSVFSQPLKESTLRVPLIVQLPEKMQRQRLNLVGLEDIAPTLLNLANTSFKHPVSGISLLEYTSNDRIAIKGVPLTLSLRTKRWRFTWQSGLEPYTAAKIGEAQIIEFADMDRYRFNRRQEDWLKREPAMAEELQELLLQHIRDFPHPQPNGHLNRAEIVNGTEAIAAAKN